MNYISLGRYFGLDVTISRAGLLSYLLLAIVAALLGSLFRGLAPAPAVLAGALTSVIFFLSEMLHQAGHAAAARRVGHPMIGVHVFSLFGGSIYPRDEPHIPPRAHATRALGGFWINVLIGLLLLPLALYLWPRDALWAWVAAVAAFNNLIVLGLGSLLPIAVPGGGGGITDGGTLLRLWRERRAGGK